MYVGLGAADPAVTATALATARAAQCESALFIANQRASSLAVWKGVTLALGAVAVGLGVMAWRKRKRR